tara:strand:+ start:296 stop:559 length:264 start_codon:yes stop_codon:yes gene_type:complete
MAARFPTMPRMVWLEKPHWLAPPLDSAFRPAKEVLPAIIEQVHAWRAPQQVMLRYSEREDNEQRYERLFLVPDNWPRQVPLPPRIRD